MVKYHDLKNQILFAPLALLAKVDIILSFLLVIFSKQKMNEVVLVHKQSKQLAASTTFLCTVER